MNRYYYLDTSAQVKYYVTELGTDWVRRLVETTDPVTGHPLNQLFTAALTVAEAAAAFAILVRVGRISKWTGRQTFNRYMETASHRFHLLPVTEQLIDVAAHLTQHHPLKGYDAVQVAAALALQRTLEPHRPLTFVAGDKTILSAAQAEGLSVDNPFWHVADNEIPVTPH